MKPKKLTQSQIQNTVRAAVTDAVSFIESEIAPDRLKAQKYMDGKSKLPVIEGRSTVVATKCRDTVRAIKPALMRLFLQSGKPVEFVPTRPETAQAAEQATAYASMIFKRNGGFQILADVFHDALVKKVGIVKVWYEESPEAEIDNYSGLTPDQWAFLLQDPETEILEAFQDPTGLISAKVSRVRQRGAIKLCAVPPEDFFVDRSAKDAKTAYVVGFSSETRVGDVVAMGFDFERVLKLAGAKQGTTSDEEQIERTGWDDTDADETSDDPSMRTVVLTEAYMRMDIEGTGVPKRYKFICAGNDYEVLDYELCDYEPFAVFEVDPEPHTFFGRSLVEIITDDQDASTALLRGLLDSIAMMNNPRMEAVENQVNMKDLLNNEIGAVIRVKQVGQLREITMGGAATAALPAMQFYDEQIRQKTGIVGGGMGLDVDALQSQTAAGVRMAEQVTNAVAELIARTLAEGGMAQLFKTIAQITRQHPDQAEMLRIDGAFVPVDPRSWATDMDMEANIGLGTGRHEEKMATLQQTLQTQMGLWQTYGPSNGLVTMTNIRATLVDILRLGGVANVDRYYQPMNPEREQQLADQAAQAAQGQEATDPNQAYLQVEQMKAQAKVQTDAQRIQIDREKAMTDAQLRAQELALKDDLARDKMAQDLALEAAKIAGQHSIAVNTAAVRAQQAMPRV